MRLWRRTMVVALVGAGALVIPGAAQAGSESCARTGPTICVDVAHQPDTVSVSTSASTSYLSYSIAVRNDGRSSATHATLRAVLPAGTQVVGAIRSAAACSTDQGGAVVKCDFGKIPGGRAAPVVEFDATAPAATGTATLTATVSVDERDNDSPKPDPKQDSTTGTDTVQVTPRGRGLDSWVPAGIAFDGTTDATGTGTPTARQPQIAEAQLPALPTGISASLDITKDTTCPGYVCTKGTWTEDSLPVPAGTSGLKLSYLLDASLLRPGQDASNLVLWYQRDASSPIVKIPRCSTKPGWTAFGGGGGVTSNCVVFKQDRSGDVRADFFTDHNGRARV